MRLSASFPGDDSWKRHKRARPKAQGLSGISCTTVPVRTSAHSPSANQRIAIGDQPLFGSHKQRARLSDGFPRALLPVLSEYTRAASSSTVSQSSGQKVHQPRLRVLWYNLHARFDKMRVQKSVLNASRTLVQCPPIIKQRKALHLCQDHQHGPPTAQQSGSLFEMDSLRAACSQSCARFSAHPSASPCLRENVSHPSLSPIISWSCAR